MPVDLDTVISFSVGFIAGTLAVASLYAFLGVKNKGELAELIRNNFTT